MTETTSFWHEFTKYNQKTGTGEDCLTLYDFGIPSKYDTVRVSEIPTTSSKIIMDVSRTYQGSGQSIFKIFIRFLPQEFLYNLYRILIILLGPSFLFNYWCKLRSYGYLAFRKTSQVFLIILFKFYDHPLLHNHILILATINLLFLCYSYNKL